MQDEFVSCGLSCIRGADHVLWFINLLKYDGLRLSNQNKHIQDFIGFII
jgi:hypothetical protein